MKQRLAAAAVLGLSATLALAACGSSSKSSSSGGSASGAVTIKLVAADYGTGASNSSQTYWQGVAEGVFEDDGKARAGVSGVAGKEHYHQVIDVIAAFDRLARAEYAQGSRRFGPPDLDRTAWRAAVSQMLVDVLNEPNVADREPILVI